MALTIKTKRKPPLHAKKRVGQHHRQSKHYLKPYLPYLPALLVIAAGFLINTLWSSPGQVLGAHTELTGSSLLASTNAARISQHEATLSLNPQLTVAAQAKAADMVTRNYWAHTTPDGKAPWSFIAATGYNYQAAGENLAYGFDSAQTVINGWMSSPEHRANLLDAAYSDVGFGIASAANYQGKGPEIIIVALYAQPGPAAANITFNVPQASPANLQKTTASIDPAARLVSRIQVLTHGQNVWSLSAVSFVTGMALTVYVVRHGRRLHAVLVRSEAWVSHHPWIDTGLVMVIVAGVLLTRTNGVIR